MLSGLELIIVMVAVFVGATVMGSVSFGMGLVVAPVLLLFLAPQSAVVVVNSIIAIVLVLVLVQVRHNLDLKLLRGMPLGGLGEGQRVNVATDVLGRYVAQLVEPVLASRA